MKTLGRRSLVLIVLAILLVALPGCQGKTLEPSAEATPEEIIRSLGTVEANWRAWDALHKDDIKWMDAPAMNTELADPLSCGTVFFCGSDAAASPAEVAKLLISAMLDSLRKH